MFTKIRNKMDSICIAARIRFLKFEENLDGMETLQVIIIIAIALVAAVAVLKMVQSLNKTANQQLQNFNSQLHA